MIHSRLVSTSPPTVHEYLCCSVRQNAGNWKVQPKRVHRKLVALTTRSNWIIWITSTLFVATNYCIPKNATLFSISCANSSIKAVNVVSMQSYYKDAYHYQMRFC